MGKHRKLIVYLIFVISVIYGVYFHFFSDRTINSENRIGNDRIEKQTENYIEVSAGDLILASTQSPFILPAGWGRNPFRLLTKKKSTSSDNEPINKAGRIPRLTGISYYESGQCFAIIDNRVLRPSEKISGWRVQSVKKDHVIIKRDDVENKLLLGEIK